MNDETLTQPLELYLQISEKNGNPALEVRKLITDAASMKAIISAAMWNRPVAVYPTFRERLRALNNLQERGIIFMAEDGSYHFNI